MITHDKEQKKLYLENPLILFVVDKDTKKHFNKAKNDLILLTTHGYYECRDNNLVLCYDNIPGVPSSVTIMSPGIYDLYQCYTAKEEVPLELIQNIYYCVKNGKNPLIYYNILLQYRLNKYFAYLIKGFPKLFNNYLNAMPLFNYMLCDSIGLGKNHIYTCINQLFQKIPLSEFEEGCNFPKKYLQLND